MLLTLSLKYYPKCAAIQLLTRGKFGNVYTDQDLVITLDHDLEYFQILIVSVINYYTMTLPQHLISSHIRYIFTIMRF